jgi:hypothetical protein
LKPPALAGRSLKREDIVTPRHHSRTRQGL